MIDDEHHEAFGAMTHRGLVEQQTNTRNYHADQKKALDVAIAALENISDVVNPKTLAYDIAGKALNKIEKILK